MKISSIQFIPGAASDVLVIKDDADTGPAIWNVTVPSTASVIKYFDGAYHRPYLDFSACTLTAGSVVIIVLETGR